MRRVAAVAWLMLVCALLATPAAAQNAISIDEVDTRAYPSVRVTMTAPLEAVGRELTADDVTVLESGEPRAVDVAVLPTDDMHVMLVLDTSGSMLGEPLAAAKRAAKVFAAQLPAEVPVGVLAFGSTPRLIDRGTTDDAALGRKIDRLDATGETALYDAVLAGVQSFPGNAALRRSMVVLSDGGDTTSTATLGEAVRKAKASGVSIDAVALQTGETSIPGLRRIAAAAGGQVAKADDPAALTAIYAEVASQLVNRYVLTYRSLSDGRTHLEVQVRVEGTTATATRRLRLPEAPASAADSPAEPAPQPRPGVVAVASALERPAVMAIGAAMIFAGLLVLLLLGFGTRRPQVRLSGGVPHSDVAAVSRRAVAAAEVTLDRRGWSAPLNAALESAGLPVRAGEFVLLTALATLAGFFVGVMLGGLLPGLFVAAVAALGARLLIRVKADRRQAAFTDQLGDTLQVLAGSLRAGHGLLQAIDAVSRDAENPTAEEFRRLVVETRLGRDLNRCLEAMSVRLRNEDFSWVVQAIAIHRDVGGDLAEVLDRVAETIRERNQVRGQIKALSAEGRLSAWILLALPFVAAAGISLTNPDYIKPLFTEPIGLVLLGIGAVLMAVGTAWIRVVVRMKF